MMRRGLLVAFVLWSTLVDLNARGPWVTLEGGHFLRKRANDGDSFHVSVNGEEYIFRLYFVDAPETTAEFVTTIQQQATAFGISQQRVIELGAIAKNFTRDKLGSLFLIQTCWENAPSRSRLPRFYAIVTTPNGDLAEQLVENGLAIVKGRQDSPDGVTAAKREWQRLNQLQQKAKREKVGGWAQSQQLALPAAAGNAISPSQIPENKLDVNTASLAELQNIPNIGPTLAQRIIDGRPYHSADELRRVKGIGSGKRYSQIRPYFQ